MSILFDLDIQREAGDDSPRDPIGTPTQLFERWLDKRWDPTHPNIDFTLDTTDWALLPEPMKAGLRLAALEFLVGEQLVTQFLAPIVYSSVAEDDEQRFLVTQMADEGVHALFFERVRESLLGFVGSSSVRDILPGLSGAFTDVFGALSDEVEQVRLRPDDPAAWVRAVTMYHLTVEGFLALPAQIILKDFLKNCAHLIPGCSGFLAFQKGLAGIQMDESRHILGGMIMLARRIQEDPKLVAPIVDRLVTVAEPVMKISGRQNLRAMVSSVGSREHSPIAKLQGRLTAIGVPADQIVRVGAKFRRFSTQ